MLVSFQQGIFKLHGPPAMERVNEFCSLGISVYTYISPPGT